MERSLDRLKDAVAKSEGEFVAKLDEQWLSSVADQYRGHSVKEIQADEDGLGWDGSLDQEGVGKLSSYVEDPTAFLILRGTSGTGKSTLAATLGRDIVKNHKVSGRFINSVALLSEFSFRSEHADPVSHFASFGVLVIDDLGAVNESLTPHQQKALWSLIEARWSNSDKITIITTNMAIQDSKDGKGLSSWIGESGWDRITSDLTRVTMIGESFRY